MILIEISSQAIVVACDEISIINDYDRNFITSNYNYYYY